MAEIDQDLTSALRFWNGPHLDLADCPRFDDVCIAAMATQENGVFNCAPYVRSFDIYECPNFSVAALRGLVESKLHLTLAPELPNHLEPIFTRFERICVSDGAPPFSPEDVAWFRDNVTYFYCPELCT